MNFQHSPLVSVHRTRRPCPVCGHRDNCAVSDNGTYCRRVRSDYQGRDGGWWHPNTDAGVTPRPVPVVKPSKPPAPQLDRGKVDLVYQALLRSLSLLPAHRDGLRSRGLDELAIVRGKFKSTPTEAEAAAFIASLGLDPSGVPGFFKDGSGWRMVKVPSGFFVPVLDRGGLIRGLQVRRDNLKGPKDPRYMWFSSNGYPLGTSPGSPVHVQCGERIAATGRVIITEGALKAFVASNYLAPEEGGLLGIGGVGTFRDEFGEQIKSAWPELETAVIAFDRDWAEKVEVKRQLHRLVRVLKSADLSVVIRTWEQEKGLDDFLLAESYEVAEVVAA